MAAVTAQSNFLASAAVFAGGLAVGIGGAVALSRAAFSPATKVQRSTRNKVKKAVSLPSEAEAQEQADDDDIPASEQLDDVDEKGAGPRPVDGSKGPVKPLIKSSVKKAAKSTSLVGGTDVPEPAAQNRAKHVDTRMDLTGPVPAHGDNVANDESLIKRPPVWLTGVPERNVLSTSTGVIDKVTYQSSTAVFVYESATNAGFGAWSEREAADAKRRGFVQGRPRVFSMQTRTGAGAAIAGYLSEKGTSSASTALSPYKNVVSALTNAQGFLAMAPAIGAIAPNDDGRLVLQVSGAAQVTDDATESLSVINDYAAILSATSTLASLNEDFTVVLSADREESTEVAAACYAPGAKGNVAHVFDGAFAGRQIARLETPAVVPANSIVDASPARTVTEALHAKGFTSFVYEGPKSPKTLIVVPNGSHFTAAKAVMLASQFDASKFGDSVGILAVRILRPWSNEEFAKQIPQSVEHIHVVDEVRSAPGAARVLFEDVQASLSGKQTPTVQALSFQAGQALSGAEWYGLLESAASTSQLNLETIIEGVQNKPSPSLTLTSKLASFFDSDSSATAQVANLASRTFRERATSGQCARLLSRFDNFEAGGVVRSDVIFAPAGDAQKVEAVPLPLAAQSQGTHTLVVGDPASILKAYNVFDSLAPGGTVIVNSPGWDGAEFGAKLRAEDRRLLAERNARIYLVDANAVVERLHDATAKALGGKQKVNNQLPKEAASGVLVAIFLRQHFNVGAPVIKGLLQRVLGTAPLGVGGVSGLVDEAERGTQLVAFAKADWAKAEPVSEVEVNAPSRPTAFRYNGFGPSVDAAAVGLEPAPVRSTWALPAWELMFREAYHLDDASLRPDLPEENWVLKVTENRRLTPVDYERNVFHLEFSTKGTNLKYEVGEALGIHGHNDAQEVRDFIAWSGYDADEIVSVPSLQDPSRYESRTVFQLLQQRLDIFGKPPKRFYEALSKLATNKDEAKWLRFISSAEGQSTFKKLAEVETVTYADVLRMFPSARLPLDHLMSEVEAIKPRHYSIASAQSFVGDVVHLLIVTVDWRTPSGSPRYGQCTRYLANLAVGDSVTVSLKPSVMKLPPHTTQPIIMSGLGTGAAPFRAYIQARAVQKREGKNVGPLIYIFGSRHKSKEYLYGEELEAYEADGLVKVLTAFSRDQKDKIYIQHRIEQNQQEILDLLMPSDKADEVQGMFTLCGPTDPLPDVQEALIKGYINKTGKTHEDGEAWLEELKEKEMAVYEVY
ncbi:hypothetical protein FA10DRAFT_267144 [Acaromyces ingoldii]|uniref:assimilatory sulfite reductase (NADPH) n=1 Tax=Acaromyces ingoldii TaxID=215250 RepID=A0A316YMV0_9BASI|nr:hypothetical protein FA10DRAFT_267144 [Acaromyces ingoldii]PWN90697.1 hypothetical protein FA10DRAFT_267144 [Acaromyces ingoldii]